jgi:hypothetical protein
LISGTFLIIISVRNLTSLFGGYRSGPASKEAIKRALTDLKTQEGFVVFKNNVEKNQKTERAGNESPDNLNTKRSVSKNTTSRKAQVKNTPQYSRQGSSSKRTQPVMSPVPPQLRDVNSVKVVMREAAKPTGSVQRKKLSIGVHTEKFSPLNAPLVQKDRPSFRAVANANPAKSPLGKTLSVTVVHPTKQPSIDKAIAQQKKLKEKQQNRLTGSNQTIAQNIKAYRSAMNGTNAPTSVLSRQNNNGELSGQPSATRETLVNFNSKIPLVTGVLQNRLVIKGAINRSVLRSQNLLKSQNLHNYLEKDKKKSKRNRDRKSSASSFRSHSINIDDRRSIGSHEEENPKSPLRMQPIEKSLQRELDETNQLISKLKVLTDSTNLDTRHQDHAALSRVAERSSKSRPVKSNTTAVETGSDSLLEKMYRDLIKRTNTLYKEIYVD